MSFKAEMKKRSMCSLEYYNDELDFENISDYNNK